jgi:hypothetical protein
MAQTNMMRADDIVNAFNGVTERQYWKASIAGTRVYPEVHFNSRSTMVRVVYRIQQGEFTVTFSRSSAAFGDFLASAYKALAQVLASLKAAGLPFSAPLDEAPVLRIEYGPLSKDATVYLAKLGDDWPEAEPAPFKVPERNNDENGFSGLDGL